MSTRPDRVETIWLGELIRSRRRGRFSLEALAQRSNISVGLLSEIERGKGNPSFSTLLKLADALDMEPADFFRVQSTAWNDEHIVKQADRQRMSLPDGLSVEILSPRLNLSIVMWKFIYPPGYDGRDQPFAISAETSFLLARGKLIIDRSDGSDWHLEAGDALRLETGMVFRPRNGSKAAAEAIAASSVPPL